MNEISYKNASGRQAKISIGSDESRPQLVERMANSPQLVRFCNPKDIPTDQKRRQEIGRIINELIKDPYFQGPELFHDIARKDLIGDPEKLAAEDKKFSIEIGSWLSKVGIYSDAELNYTTGLLSYSRMLIEKRDAQKNRELGQETKQAPLPNMTQKPRTVENSGR